MKAELSDMGSIIEMRIAYIESDLGTINESDRTKMHKQLPEYFTKHLNRDVFAFIEKPDVRVIAMALLLVIEKPSSPNFINGKIGNVQVCTQFLSSDTKAYQQN